MHGLKPILSKPETANLIGIGSVLGWIPENFSGMIFGSGLMRPEKKSFPYAKILSVRGEFTRQCLGLPVDIPLGDPGIISDSLIDIRLEKKYVLGLIPHFENKDDEIVKKILKKYPNDLLLIDVERQPIEVLKDIDSCQFIASSSLHGLIVADSLGIPNVWLLITKQVGGGMFKFEDYGTALNQNIKPYVLTGDESLSDILRLARTPSDIIHSRKAQVYSTLRVLKYTF